MRRRLLAFIFAFVALTALGLAFALRSSHTTVDELVLLLDGLPLQSIVIALGCVAALHVTDAVRTRTFARLFGVRLPWSITVDVLMANNLFAWLTPGAVGGAPAAMAMLVRGGVAPGVAALIPVAKSMIGALVIVVAGAVAAVGFGGLPPLPPAVRAALVWGVLIVVVVVALLVLGALAPVGASRLLERAAARAPVLRRPLAAVGHVVADLARCRERPGWLALALLSQVPYFAAVSGLTVAALHAFGADDLVTGTARAVVSVAILYLSPTPGGAGVVEVTTARMFGDLLYDGAAAALAVMTVVRALTFWIEVPIGACWLLVRGALGVAASGRR